MDKVEAEVRALIRCAIERTLNIVEGADILAPGVGIEPRWLVGISEDQDRVLLHRLRHAREVYALNSTLASITAVKT